MSQEPICAYTFAEDINSYVKVNNYIGINSSITDLLLTGDRITLRDLPLPIGMLSKLTLICSEIIPDNSKGPNKRSSCQDMKLSFPMAPNIASTLISLAKLENYSKNDDSPETPFRYYNFVIPCRTVTKLNLSFKRCTKESFDYLGQLFPNVESINFVQSAVPLNFLDAFPFLREFSLDKSTLHSLGGAPSNHSVKIVRFLDTKCSRDDFSLLLSSGKELRRIHLENHKFELPNSTTRSLTFEYPDRVFTRLYFKGISTTSADTDMSIKVATRSKEYTDEKDPSSTFIFNCKGIEKLSINGNDFEVTVFKIHFDDNIVNNLREIEDQNSYDDSSLYSEYDEIDFSEFESFEDESSSDSSEEMFFL